MSHEHAETIITAEQLCRQLGGKLVGDGSVQISGINSLDLAGSTELSFVSLEKHTRKLEKSQAVAVLVSKELAGVCKTQLLVENVDASLIEALNLFAPKLTVDKGVHPAAVVEDDAVVGENVSIGANAYIGHRADIASDCVIGASVNVGENSVIGDNTRLDSGVSIYHNCKIGRNCIIQSNSTIGAVGFGYSFIDGQHRLIPHNGGVVIEDCVEIGANVCVDRAKFDNTMIGAGTKIDNLVQIGHNCVVGKCCLIVSYAALAGSAVLGDGVVMAGRSGVADGVKVGDGVMIGAAGSVFHDVPPGKKLLGLPARDAKVQIRIYGIISRLPKMYKQLCEVAKKVKKLEASENNKK